MTQPTSDPRIDQLTSTLREVLATFGPMSEVYGGPVSYYDGSADIEVVQFEKWQAILNGTEELPDGFKRAEHVMVACAVCGYEYDEDEFIHVFKSVADAKGAAVGSGWDELKDGRVLCETGDEVHDELRRTVGVVDQDA